MLKEINGHLSNDLNQRIIYGLGLTLWTYLMWDTITEFTYSAGSYGSNDITLYIGPALLLVLQVVRNNQLLWGLIFGLMTASIFVALYFLISDEIERNPAKAMDWDVIDILVLFLFFGVLFIMDWIIYKIRPKRLI
jgi:hypothetical protein